jgi:hypothetical protein
MTDVNALYLKAAREKYRFQSAKGSLTIEDLWDLPLTARNGGASLDEVARDLHRRLKDAEDTVSFVTPTARTTTDLQDKMEIVKHVIAVKMAERDAAKAAEERAAAKQRIMQLIAEKKDAQLADASIEELEQKLAEL